MKALIALGLLQTCVLVLLFTKIVAVQEQTPEKAYAASHNGLSDNIHATAVRADSRQGVGNVSESRLREIIREELTAYASQSRLQAATDSLNSAHERPYTSENHDQLEYVIQKLDYFASTGSISKREMLGFEAEIARLHPADRQKILNRLVQSMNAGKIKAEL
jgi:hypothetical protein